MTDELRLMAVLAHPDDESLGLGGSLARYSKEGVQTFLVTATRGERGRYGDLPERPSIENLGRIREAELREAAKTLGVREVNFLDYVDKDLDKANPREVIAKIVYHIRNKKPHVIVTFGPDGAYGHPDHIAISQFTGAAIACAADSSYDGYGDIHVAPGQHRVSKFYYMAWTRATMDAYQEAFKTLKLEIDGVERQATALPDWQITTKIDTSDEWETVWEAVQHHKTQLTIYEKLKDLPQEHHRAIWGIQQFYRVFSTVNGGREIENDLFEGLR